MKSSQISGFYKLSVKERQEIVKKFAELSGDEVKILEQNGLSLERAERMIENVVGKYELPLGIATNFLINGKDYLIPMVLEEPSVVAAASNAARIARVRGGFKTKATEPVMMGQIQLVNVKNPEKTKKIILKNKKKILELANKQDPVLVKLGGGAKKIEVRNLAKNMMVVHLLVNVKDAMGANAVNTMCEAVAPFMEKIAGEKTNLRILSNYATERLVKTTAIFDKNALGGEGVVDSIISAYRFADCDVYRAVTHNKGIMNGIVAVALATGNDTRALEAEAHAYASRSGKYKPLTVYKKDKNGNLVGSLEMPLAVGIVGGATSHPVAKIVLKILGVKSAKELAEIMDAVGLAQNLAALKALSTEGIQRGHMELHARNIAIMAGAAGKKVDKIAEQMVKEKRVRLDRAKELL